MEGIHSVDHIAAEAMPDDIPKHLVPVKVVGDGNCLSRGLSIALSGTDALHLHTRALIVIEGIHNKRFYIDHNCLDAWS